MTIRPWICALCALVAIGCGGATEETLPDESGDLELGEAGSSFSSAGTTPVGPEIGGTQWRWVEAHCTEGPLDLSGRGFSSELRITSDATGLLLTHDHVFERESCTQTVITRASPTRDRRVFTMKEEVRIAQPATDECAGRMEQERPGEVRRSGELLEVLTQRSFVWCNGFEVRMVYAAVPSAALTNEQIVRRWAAHFNRRDATAVSALFAESGSLVEPFHVTRTGGASRHDGRAAIRAYYDETFRGVEWLALRVEETRERGNGQMTVDWRYIDPRVEEPFGGRNHFTIAAGEIYEARIELTDPPPEQGAEGEAEASSGK
jgi:hypothetical protein